MTEEKDKAGLTATEKEIVKSTWDLMKMDVSGNGFDLFFRFFAENPLYQKLFKSFKDVPLYGLKDNKKLSAHAMNVMYAISMLVDNIDNTEVLVEMLENLAKNHARRKISIEMFENLKLSLIGTLKHKLGSNLMNDAAISAWDKTYGVIIAIVKPGLERTVEDD